MRVSVLVPHFARRPEDSRLDRIVAALDVAVTHPGRAAMLEEAGLVALGLAPLGPDDVELVVGDDGSPEAPALPDRTPAGIATRVLTQEDQGFRAAAARHLAASAATGEVLVMLDADMLPVPGTLEQLEAAARGLDVVNRRDAGQAEGSAAPTLAVGRRLHHDPTGWSAGDLAAWLRGERPGPEELPAPQWLADGYRHTDDLRAADDASFRYVISAVCALPAELYRRVGGFDTGFVGYGGEDWELAQRCWLAGAELRHVPDAVAWHDGPEIAGRAEDLAAVKNAETAHLSTRLTHPLVRGRGPVRAIPDVVVEADLAGWTLGQALVVLGEWLRGADVGLWCRNTDDAVLAAFAEDPRVRSGEPSAEVTARCRWRVRLTAPAHLTDDAHRTDDAHLTNPLLDALLPRLTGPRGVPTAEPLAADPEARIATEPDAALPLIAHARWLALAGDAAWAPLPTELTTHVPADVVAEHTRGRLA